MAIGEARKVGAFSRRVGPSWCVALRQIHARCRAREDLRTYRSTLPAIAARHSQRGILNWVHDQFFAGGAKHFEPRVPDGTLPPLPTVVESVEIEKDAGSE